MGAHTEDVFGNDAEKLVEAYLRGMKTSTSFRLFPELLLRQMAENAVELNSRAGHTIAQYSPDRYVEACSGIAIPSLALTKLGYGFGQAFDIKEKYVELGRELARDLGIHSIDYDTRDFYKWFPSPPEGTMLIAIRPRQDGANIGNKLESDILELAIKKDYNIALLACVECDVMPTSSCKVQEMTDQLRRKNDKYLTRLSSVGYQTDLIPMSELTPERLVVGVK